MTTAQMERPVSVIAPMHFITKYDGVHYAMSHGASTIRYDPFDIPVTDARTVDDVFDLERNGFALAHHHTAVADFLDEGQVTEIYLPEVEQLIREATGGSIAKVFQWASRAEGGEKTGGRQPGRHAHCDYTEKTYRVWAEKMFGAEEAGRLLAKHWMVINVWRGIGVVESTPLAVCDASTVDDADMHEVTILVRPGDTEKPLYGHPIEYREHQRWYYFPLMQPEEVLIFKQYDTAPGSTRWGAHCAFDDPRTAPGAAPRQSFEVRALVFFDA